jgi:hypothetical protein
MHYSKEEEMTNDDIINEYKLEIAAVRAGTEAAMAARIRLDDYQNKLKVAEAELLIHGGVEGKNAEERSARLLLLSWEESADCERHRIGIERARLDIAATDADLAVARENCRLYRLLLAQSISPAVLEVSNA